MASCGRRSRALELLLVAMCSLPLLVAPSPSSSSNSVSSVDGPLIVPLETRHGAHRHRGRSLLRYGTLPILGAVREG